jgi:hypothetical protein
MDIIQLFVRLLAFGLSLFLLLEFIFMCQVKTTNAIIGLIIVTIIVITIFILTKRYDFCRCDKCNGPIRKTKLTL